MNEGYQSFGSANFDPNQMANLTSSAIMFVVVLDVSPSIRDFAQDMNLAAREIFMRELKECHRKDDIIIKGITFCDIVEHKSGFLPIVNLQDDYLDVTPTGSGTALYQAVLEALDSAVSYRADLEGQGVDVRTCIFIITDGADISSKANVPAQIRKKVEELRTNEAWVASFTINMLGVGKESVFRAACVEMGLNPDVCLSTIGKSAAEIRKQMGVISQSVSSSSKAATVSF